MKKTCLRAGTYLFPNSLQLPGDPLDPSDVDQGYTGESRCDASIGASEIDEQI